MKTYKIECHERVEGNGPVCWQGNTEYTFQTEKDAQEFISSRLSYLGSKDKNNILFNENEEPTDQYIVTDSIKCKKEETADCSETSNTAPNEDRTVAGESYYRMIPQFTLSVGKYTNSYKHHIGLELAGDGYACRLAMGQIDDTCFSDGKTFYSLEDAIRGIKQSIIDGDCDFAAKACDGLLYGLNTDWKEFDEEP